MPQPLAPTARSSSRSSKRSDAPGVAVGEIVGAHALRGVLRVRPYQPPAPSLTSGRTVRLETAGEHRLGRVVAASPHGRGLVLLALEGVEDRTAAQALVGFRIVIDPDDLPPPAADEFYYHEVVGFGVETPGGRRLGHIHTTFATGTNDVWIVRDDEGCREHLIPVIADVVRTIDRDAHRVVIEPLPGLLED